MTKQKILFADDDSQYRKSLANALFSEYVTDFASNANEEIAKAKKNHYDLILTDNQMNDGYGNSGLYAIEQIRKFDKKTPIIFHTAALSKEINLEAIAKGANEILSKPINFSEFNQILRKYLGEKK